jgi:protein-L-isoaspartate(D-aspartate) O-methyltransferase
VANAETLPKEIDAVRRTYAEAVCAKAGVPPGPLMDAFARVPRERFLGPGPWQIVRFPLDPAVPYRTTPDAGFAHIYEDVLVAIDPARQLNNGQPSGHARWIAAASPRAGESVLHIGCGTGYYTAIFADIVGPSGRVTALEIDAELARGARANLSGWPQVRVEAGDGGEPAGSYDVIYVNAGATHARKGWLHALAESGRLVLPLTAHVSMSPHGVGFVVCTEGRGHPWPARIVSPVGIYDCSGARDGEAESQISRLMSQGLAERIRAVSIEPHERGDECLVHVEGFCLR